jgi:ATP-binding cassette subfamily C protein
MSRQDAPPVEAATSGSGHADAPASATDPTQSAEKGGAPNTVASPVQSVSRLLKRLFDNDFRSALSRTVAGCRTPLAIVAAFSFTINMLILAIPIYLFQISDRVLTSRSTDTLVMLTVVVVGALAAYTGLDIVRRLILTRVATHFETSLGGPVLSAAAKAAQFGSTREFQCLQDLQNIRNFITGPVLLALFDAPVAPIYFLALFLIHPHLGIIVTVSAIALVAVALINQRVTAVPFARSNTFSLRANVQAEAMARNAQVLNAMGMIREGVMVWGREVAESLKAQVAGQDRNVYMTGVSKALRLLSQVALLGWGAVLALNGELTGGMMIAASIIGSRAMAPVEGLIEGWRSVVQARSGYARISALLQTSPLNQDRLTLPKPEGRITVERVLYVPPPSKKVVLNGINFSLEPGESLAIIGPSGTGKSTLARMLVGSIAPTSGSVRLDMMDIRNWDPRQFGETVGYLPQEIELFPTTIKANIARLREDVPDRMIFEAAAIAGVHDMIAELPQGYETMIGMDGSPLSGGQRQRLGLARAFFGNPKLVVLDEPNSNLDTAGEAALAAALMRAKRQRITVVAVTQRPSLLRCVDKIMVMGEGKLLRLGPREEILSKISTARSESAEVHA